MDAVFETPDGYGSKVRSYRDLQIWQRSLELAVACFGATKGFPASEAFGLTSQIRRAAGSIPANIAEGFGRWNVADFIRFLRIAQGSLKELETHLLLSERVAFLDPDAAAKLLAECNEIGRMLHAFIASLQKRKSRRT